jgi:hypothetical protein
MAVSIVTGTIATVAGCAVRVVVEVKKCCY